MADSIIYSVGVDVNDKKVDDLINKLKSLDKQVDSTGKTIDKLATATSKVKTDGLDKAADGFDNIKKQAESAGTAVEGVANKADKTGQKLDNMANKAGSADGQLNKIHNTLEKIREGRIDALKDSLGELGVKGAVVQQGMSGLGSALNFAAMALGFKKVGDSVKGVTEDLKKMNLEVTRSGNTFSLNDISKKKAGDYLANSKNPAIGKFDTSKMPVPNLAGPGANGAVQALIQSEAGLARLAGLLPVVGGLLGLGVAALAAYGAAAVATTLHVAELGDKLDELSTRTNISVERIQVIDNIAKMAGSSFDQLQGSAEGLSKKLSKQDDDTGKLVKSMKEIGVTTKDNEGKQKSALQVQEELVLAAQKAGAGSKAEAVAVQALGTEYYKIRGAVIEVAEKKAAMYKLMSSTGALITTEMAKKSGELNDKIDGMKIAFSGLGVVLAEKTIGPLTKVVELISKAVTLFAQWNKGPSAPEAAQIAVNTADAGIAAMEKRVAQLQTQVKGKEGTPWGQGVLAEINMINQNLDAMKKKREELQGAANQAAVEAAAKENQVVNGADGEGVGTNGAGEDSKAKKIEDYMRKVKAEISGLQNLSSAYAAFDQDRINAAQQRVEVLKQLADLEVDPNSDLGKQIAQLETQKKGLEQRNQVLQQALQLHQQLAKSAATIGFETQAQTIAWEVQYGTLKNLNEELKKKLVADAKAADEAKWAQDSKKMLEDLQKQTANLNFYTREQALAYELEHGALKNLDATRKQALLTAAKELDQATALKRVKDDLFQIEQRRQAALGTIANRGLSDRDQQKAGAALQLDQAEAAEKRNVTDPTVLDAISQKYQQLRANANEFYAADEAARSDWLSGMLSGFRTSLDEQNNLYNQGKQFAQGMEQSWSSNFEAMLRGTKSLKQGFKDMIADMIVQLLKMTAYRQILNGLMALGGSMFGSGFTQGAGAGIGTATVSSGMTSADDWMLAGMSGGRATGGPVMGGKLYQVNETGSSEMFNVGGKQYLMPAQNGYVTPSAGGGTTQNITIQITVQGGNTNEETGQVVSQSVVNAMRGIARDEMQRGNQAGGVNNPMALR